MEKELPDVTMKLILLGEANVGKSSIMNQMVHKNFDLMYTTTIGVDFYIKNIIYDNLHYKLQIWDTAGQEKFANLINNYYRTASCAIVVFDITNYTSFNKVDKCIESFNCHTDSERPIILVGNKLDLHRIREVSLEEARDKADKYNSVYLECSAKRDNNIHNIFTEAIRIVNKILVNTDPKVLNVKLKKNVHSFEIETTSNSSKMKKNECCVLC
jgi:small GTP-binding protein